MSNNIDEGYRLGYSMNDKNHHVKSSRNAGYNIVNNSQLPG